VRRGSGLERKKGKRKKKGGHAGPRLARDSGWPAWHLCRAGACGAAKAGCHATRDESGRERSGKHPNRSCSCFCLPGTGTGREQPGGNTNSILRDIESGI
jgi:hypothetical protein